MLDSYVALTVFLVDAIKDEDAKPIMEAIRMVRGVRAVEPIVDDDHAMWAKETAKDDLRSKLLDVLRVSYTPREL